MVRMNAASSRGVVELPVGGGITSMCQRVSAGFLTFNWMKLTVS